MTMYRTSLVALVFATSFVTVRAAENGEMVEKIGRNHFAYTWDQLSQRIARDVVAPVRAGENMEKCVAALFNELHNSGIHRGHAHQLLRKIEGQKS